MSSLFTLLTFPSGKVPEVTLKSRPFADCHTVGMNWLERQVTQAFGNKQGNGFVTYTEDCEEVTNEARGTYKIWTGKAVFFGVAPIVTAVAVED